MVREEGDKVLVLWNLKMLSSFTITQEGSKYSNEQLNVLVDLIRRSFKAEEEKKEFVMVRDIDDMEEEEELAVEINSALFSVFVGYINGYLI